MNAGISSSYMAFQARCLLKRDTCYDRIGLFLRKKVAAYKSSDSFQKRQERDYATTIAVARKIPEKILQEDSNLLMWYDNAVTGKGEE